MIIDKLVKSKRRTISLKVTTSGELHIAAPLSMSDKEVIEFVKLKRKWIEDKIRLMQERKPESILFENGSIFRVLDKVYPIIITQEKKNIFQFDHKAFYLSEFHIEEAPDLFEKLYKVMAKSLIKTKVSHWSEIMELYPSKIRITSASTRWGSCSSNKTISINWKLLLAPSEILDYVIIHELAHLAVMNHSTKFWHVVSKFCPNYKSRLKWLKDYGSKLTFRSEE